MERVQHSPSRLRQAPPGQLPWRLLQMTQQASLMRARRVSTIPPCRMDLEATVARLLYPTSAFPVMEQRPLYKMQLVHSCLKREILVKIAPLLCTWAAAKLCNISCLLSCVLVVQHPRRLQEAPHRPPPLDLPGEPSSKLAKSLNSFTSAGSYACS